MKKTFAKSLFAAAAISASVISCTQERDSVNAEEVTANAGLEKPGELEAGCSYVDGNWSSSAVLTTSLRTSGDTNFMNSQMSKISSLFGRTSPLLRFVNDASSPNSTYNAISYSTGKIYYGYAIYYDAKAKGGDIVNAMILAHEYGHQLQYIFGLPSVREFTARPNELEADGFAGYYLRRPTGYNQPSFSAIASAYTFAANIGDYNTSSQNHHGTPSQRRSAVRLGFLLGDYSLSAKDFDYNFFYYYNGVLNGTYRNAKNTQFPEIDAMMQNHLDELKAIQTGEISEAEFLKLK